MSRIKLAMLIFTGIAVAAVAGDLLHPPNPLRRRCHIPDYSYRSESASHSRRALSNSGPILNPNVNANAVGSQKIFPFNSAELKIDHCQLKKLVLTVNSDGTWIINGEASQDVTTVEALERPQFERFKRNRFHLILKGLAADRRAEDPQTVQTGTAELFRIDPDAFWVEKGQEKSFRITGPRGNQPNLKSVYPLLQGAEAEFYYE